ncbi:MAG: hypothetical protein JW860_04485 [Sedimentisphaerales bacterium]|nr:hypothetical protein [Sedimentisphaerales bacterium]
MAIRSVEGLSFIILLLLMGAIAALVLRKDKVGKRTLPVLGGVVFILILSRFIGVNIIHIFSEAFKVFPQVGMGFPRIFLLMIPAGVLIVVMTKMNKPQRYWILAILAGVLCMIVVLAFYTPQRVTYMESIDTYHPDAQVDTNIVLKQSDQKDSIVYIDGPSVSMTGNGEGYQIPTYPEVWRGGVEQEYPADVYPSISAAAQGLGRKINDMLLAITTGSGKASRIQVTSGDMNKEVASEILHSVGHGLRSADNNLHISVDTVVQDKPIEEIDQSAATVVVDIHISQTKIFHDGQHDLFTQRSGTLIAEISGPAGRISTSVEFVEKPWVDDWSGFINTQSGRHWILAQSQTACTAEGEARLQAEHDACQQLITLLPDLRQRLPGLNIPMTMTPMQLRSRNLVVDQFAQSFQGSSSPIWREALLIDASPGKLAGISQQIAQADTRFRQTWSYRIVSLAGMLVVICVIYFFLNMATRGYYTWALRLAAIGLVLTGIIIIINHDFKVFGHDSNPSVKIMEPLPTGVEVMERSVVVSGGREMLDKINSIVTTISLSLPDRIKGRIVNYQKRPGKFHQVININATADEPVSIERGSDGTVFWEKDPQTGYRIMTGEEKAITQLMYRINFLTDYDQRFKQIECTGRQTISGEDCYKVVLTPHQSRPLTVYFSVETGLVKKLEYYEVKPHIGSILVKMVCSDYRYLNGIQIPYRFEIESDTKSTVIVENYTYNVEIPDDEFELPVEVKDLLKVEQENKAEQ